MSNEMSNYFLMGGNVSDNWAEDMIDDLNDDFEQRKALGMQLATIQNDLSATFRDNENLIKPEYYAMLPAVFFLLDKIVDSIIE